MIFINEMVCVCEFCEKETRCTGYVNQLRVCVYQKRAPGASPRCRVCSYDKKWLSSGKGKNAYACKSPQYNTVVYVTCTYETHTQERLYLTMTHTHIIAVWFILLLLCCYLRINRACVYICHVHIWDAYTKAHILLMTHTHYRSGVVQISFTRQPWDRAAHCGVVSGAVYANNPETEPMITTTRWMEYWKKST